MIDIYLKKVLDQWEMKDWFSCITIEYVLKNDIIIIITLSPYFKAY